MVRFIIVDDEEKSQKDLKNIIRKVTFDKNISIEIKCFKNYCKELDELIDDKSQRKVFLLDIDLDAEITGINIALKIRENDWDSEIIFLTNHDRYFDKVYRSIYKVFDFIEKFDHMSTRLTKDIEDILKQKYDNIMFTYQNSQIDLQIYLKDILYIHRDKDERKLVVVTENNSFKVSMTIEEMLSKLDNRFAQVHRACIGNKQRISLYKWSKGSFILDTGEEVFMLSKKFKSNVLKETIKN